MREKESTVYIKIPFQTVFLVLATLVCAKIATLISPLVLPLLIAILIAVAVAPAVTWLTLRGLNRGTAIGVVTALLALTIGLITYLIVPTVVEQITAFVSHFPEEKEKILAGLGEHSAFRSILEAGLKKGTFQLNPNGFDQIIGAGNLLLGGLTETVLIFVFSIYLIADGPRMIRWISAFFSHHVRMKLELTFNEVSKIISAYVLGQVITSALSFAFVFIVLTALHVPNVILLAAMAGLFDVLPVLGFIMAVVPAMLFALHVSGSTALIVLAAYLFYHAVENYVIVPFVYGNRLRVSSLVVFFALIAAGLAAGIEGAIAVLPFVASYPAIERIWLTHIVRQEAIEAHATESESARA